MRHYSIGGSAFPERNYIIFFGSIIFSNNYNCYVVINTQGFGRKLKKYFVRILDRTTNVGNSELAENTMKMKYFKIFNLGIFLVLKHSNKVDNIWNPLARILHFYIYKMIKYFDDGKNYIIFLV